MKLNIAGKAVSIDAEELKKALESNAESFDVQGDFVLRTTTEEDTFLSNIKKETIKTAQEIDVKKRRDELGLSFEGKNYDNLLKAYQEKIMDEAIKEPSEALSKKNQDITLLQETLSARTKEFEDVNNQFSAFKNESTINRELEKIIPSNSALPKEDLLLLMKSKLAPKLEDGRIVYHKDGNPLKDPSTLEFYGSDKIKETFFSENSYLLKQTEGGAGGGDSSPDKKGGIEEFRNNYEKNGGSTTSEDFSKKLNEAIQNKAVTM